MRTGFIGLGSQGGPMAARIAEAALPLTVWARRPEACEPMIAKGAVAATSIAELGAACGHVGVCVVDDAGVVDVCDQLIPAMQPGSCIAIHATVLPETCVAIAARAGARGIQLIDAPVSGGGPAAAAGKLTVMCGGDAEAVAACRPVFESFASTIVHLGPLGSGQRAKIVNNALMAANMGLAHAAIQVAEALSIDRAAFAELVKESSGRSFGFDVYARLAAPAAFAHGARLLAKDVALLAALRPDDRDAAALGHAAHDFLGEATETAK